MITSLKPVLADAQRRHYAVGSFNTNNLEVSQAIISGAEQVKAPVIIAMSESAIIYGGQPLFALVKELAERSHVPVVIHFDHGHKLELIQQAIEWGFSSVMIDASAFSWQKNLELTKQVVKWSKRARVSVEAELGTIGGSKESQTRGGGPAIIYPTVEQVEQFVAKTKVDALAVGLGTSHGLPVPKEHVEQELLKQIRAVTAVPLVLHGASNLPPKTIRAAIRNGITKINIDTELRQTFTQTVRRVLKQDLTEFDPRGYLGQARIAVEQVVMEKLKLFGCSHKANYVYPRYW